MNEQQPNNGHRGSGQSSSEADDQLGMSEMNEQPNSEASDWLEVRHPEITVRLSGTDGNAFGIFLGLVQQALRRTGVPEEEVDAFFEEATSGDYDHLLGTCMRWVGVE